jgi:D-sedoheptulose 7-phosphate isomerase
MNKHLEILLERYPQLKKTAPDIEAAIDILLSAVKREGKILLCGNGGSAADCEHISGELLKGFLSKRPLSHGDKAAFSVFENGAELADSLQYGVCALPLTSFSALLSAFGNDVNPGAAYAQLVMAAGMPMDVLVGISTSGNAQNVANAALTAKARGLSVVGLTGQGGGKLAELCDCCIRVPEIETFKIQELHLPVYHTICAAIEEERFG